jgi:Co/Zn/Cd efflux system component
MRMNPPSFRGRDYTDLTMERLQGFQYALRLSKGTKMGSCCHEKGCTLDALRERQGRTLRIVLAINVMLFLVELSAGIMASSTSLMADSLDSLGDALVYAFSLYVLFRSERWRAGAALLKGLIMLGFGIAITVALIGRALAPLVPVAEMIGGFGLFALASNLTCLLLLTRHRSDDINMESVWLCSRNDIIANVGVLLAAAGVAATGTMWPDFAVGSAIAVIFLRSAFYVVSQSLRGLPRHEVSAPAKQPATSAAEACQSKGAALEPAYGRRIFGRSSSRNCSSQRNQKHSESLAFPSLGTSARHFKTFQVSRSSIRDFS